MNNFFIPPSPNWFYPQILACAPDNTLIYGTKNEVIIIHPTPDDIPPKIEILPDEGCNQNSRVACVDVNPKWGSPNKWVLSSWDDKLVKIWDMKLLQWKKCSPPYKGERDNLVAARFLSEDRILSVTESGALVICHIPQLKFTHLTNLFSSKVTVTCLAPCPHSSHIIALGLKTGLIIVIDLRKNGSITHRLRGHTGDITTLSWCPAPVNIFPSKPGSPVSITSRNMNENEVKNTSISEAKNDDEATCHKEVDEKQTFDKVDVLIEANSIETKENSKEDGRELSEIRSENISNSEEIQDPENKSCETAETITEEPRKKLSDSSVTVEPAVEEPEAELSTSCEKVAPIVGEPKQQLSACEIVEPSGEEPKKELSASSETVETLMEEPNQQLSAYKTVEPMMEEAQGKLSIICGTVESMVKEPKNKLSASCEKVESMVEGSKEQLSVCETVESMVEEPQKEFSADKVEENNCLCKVVELNGEEPQRDMLLASCGKDSYVNIWRAGGDGRLVCFFKLPEKRIHTGKNKKPSSPSWHTLKWITTFSLLVGTNKGEILKYSLPKQMNVKDYTLVHNEHSNFIFAIAAHVPVLTKDNWFVGNEVKIWTFSYDMFLLNTTLDSKITHALSIETFCALVNCMTYCPVDPNRIALGLSNGSIKIWNANNSSPKFFSTAYYSPKIYGKITYLEWHPKNELMIAFSTEEGTIGLLNTNHKQKATWFKQYFSSTIHKIQWAPHEGKTCLYAMGKGSLVCFDPEKPKEEPVKVELPSDSVPYYFAWKLDMSLIMVSYNCGKIGFYESSLGVKATYYNSKKVTFMVWHPDSLSSSSPKSFWVATALDNAIYIYDFAEVMEKNGTLNIDDVVKTKIDVHFGSIKSMAWNPFNGDQIVTAGEDGCAYVLNAMDGTVLASYYDKKFQPIKTIMWSPVEEDLLIMTVSRSATLIGWKSTDYKGPLSNDILSECEKHFKNSRKSNVTPQKDGEAAKKILKSARGVILPGISAVPLDTGEDKVKILRECLGQAENNASKEKSSNIQKLFGSKDDILELLNHSEKSHITKGKLDAAATVSVFKGDLQNHITEAIEQHRVTPLLISMAPSVSTSLWQKACETYAGQICGKPGTDPLEVAIHYLASQNIEQAIEFLCEKEMYKEALALVKSRLPRDSVIIKDIIKRWAKYSSYCGNMETAALCFIKLGKYEEAVKVLFRRNDVEILGFAYDLAEITGNAELMKACRFRYNAFSVNDRIEIEKSNLLLEEDGSVFGGVKNSIASEAEKVHVNLEGQVVKKSENTEVNDKVILSEMNIEESEETENAKDDEVIQSETKIRESGENVEANGLNINTPEAVLSTHDEVTEENSSTNDN